MAAYLKIALRTFRRERLYALLNITGLALAVACCLVIALYLRGELTYDRHNVLHERIFRVENEFSFGGNAERVAVTSPVLGEMLAESFPEIQDYTRLRRASTNRTLIRHEEQAFYWDGVYFADDNVFELFTHDVIYGDPETALVDPASVAVSESFARRYFGDANPIGEAITTDSGVPVQIRLVFADLPENAHVKYDALFSANVDFLGNPDNEIQRRTALWSAGSFLYTYLLMPEGYDAADFDALAADFYERNMESTGQAANGHWRAWLRPLADVHLHADVAYDRPTGNPYYLLGFAAVGFFILLVACINYVNLATARATKRARAVGIRKILGSGRWPLVLLFLGEAVTFALISAVLGIVIVEVVLTFSPLETLIGKPLGLDLLGEPLLALVIVAFSVGVGALAGLYPALYLSSWAPLSALVGESHASRGNVRFRQLLVFAQFAISIAVISATLLMAEQMRYVQNRPLGFDKDNRVMITMRGVDLLEKAPVIMDELATDSRILDASLTALMMGQDFPVTSAQVADNEGVLQTTSVSIMQVDEDFFDAMGMKLLAGRDFSRRLLTDIGTNVVVNEALVRSMGWVDPLGKQIRVAASVGRVVGVVEDFNYKSLHNPIEPLAIMPLGDDYSGVSGINRPFVTRLLVLSIAREGMPQTLRMLEDRFASADPEHPFEFEFVDDSLDALYVSEQSLMSLLGIFAVVCIVIACLGLYGLASFTTEQRTKEIGIRKVMGASALQIILLLSRHTLLLILGGAVVAAVGAYIAIDEWLSGFAYRTDIDPLVFLQSTAIAALVAFATIALQSYRTARADPADSLRYE